MSIDRIEAIRRSIQGSLDSPVLTGFPKGPKKRAAQAALLRAMVTFSQLGASVRDGVDIEGCPDIRDGLIAVTRDVHRSCADLLRN